NLLEAIENSKSRPLSRLITGLGVRFVGTVAAQALAERFGSLDALAAATEEQITAIDGIGPAAAGTVVQFFSLAYNRALIQKLKDVGVQTVAQTSAATKASSALDGKTFVITGSLSSMSRDQAGDLIAAHGGKVTGSVTKKTSYLLTGTDPGGTKYNKAVELGIPQIDEAGLLALVNVPATPALSQSESIAETPTDPTDTQDQIRMDL
ncbi:MAG: helix-hairpin-helix domain-containing protein, partial [Chloroflexota bacterium]